MRRQLQSLSVCFLCLVIFAFSSANCFAATAQFSLPDVQTKENRVFDVTLNVSDCKDVSAFMCELEYDPTVFEYKSASSALQDAVIEVNSQSDGKLKAVFLCEDSVSAEDEISLVTFSFKALKAGEHNINLSVYDCINGEFEDLEAVCTSCLVSVAQIPVKDSSASDNGNSDKDNFNTESFSESLTDEVESGYTKVNEDKGNRFVYFAVLSVFCLLAIVGYICYKLGANKRKKVENEK